MDCAVPPEVPNLLIFTQPNATVSQQSLWVASMISIQPRARHSNYTTHSSQCNCKLRNLTKQHTAIYCLFSHVRAPPHHSADLFLLPLQIILPSQTYVNHIFALSFLPLAGIISLQCIVFTTSDRLIISTFPARQPIV